MQLNPLHFHYKMDLSQHIIIIVKHIIYID